MSLELISNKYEVSLDPACTVVKMETLQRITSDDLFPFNVYLVANGQISCIRKENNGLPVLEAFGAKIRNLGKKKGNGFHIQGSAHAQRKAEAWLATYHFRSSVPDISHIVDETDDYYRITLSDEAGSLLFCKTFWISCNW